MTYRVLSSGFGSCGIQNMSYQRKLNVRNFNHVKSIILEREVFILLWQEETRTNTLISIKLNQVDIKKINM